MVGAGCRTPATQIQLFIDTDAPADRSINLDLYAFQGPVNAENLPSRAQAQQGMLGHVALSRNDLGRGTFVAGGSLGLIPALMGNRDSVTVWVNATIAATPTSPAIALERGARFTFVRGRAGTARLFLGIVCGDQALGCTSVAASACTVGVRCREQNATCGDRGECVALEVPVTIPAEDGGVQDTGMVPPIDATVVRADAANSLMDVADVSDARLLDVADESDVNCPPNTEVLGGECVAFLGSPIQHKPGSLMDVTVLRPRFIWSLTGSYTGGVVELCRDRPCINIIETLRVDGTFAEPTLPLPPNSVVYWRLRGRRGMDVSSRYSPTWLFHTPFRSASSGANTSFHAHNDVNGDGIDDLVVGSRYGRSLAGVGTGTATIYHGGATILNAAPARFLAGVEMDDQFGFSVAGAGDLNGDGYGDLAISAPSASPNGRAEAGSVSIYYGSRDGIGSMPDRVLEGSDLREGFGTAVASAGDVNGDGWGDLIVASVLATSGGLVGAGTAKIFVGSQTGIQPAPNAVISGAAGENLGISISYIGDIDFDGFGDVLVGSYEGAPEGRASAGIARIYRGSAGGLLTVPARTFEGAVAGDRLGTGAQFAGDLNGDGRPDFVLGAYQARSLAIASAGQAHVYYGADRLDMLGTATPLSMLMRNSGFGRAVLSAGDVDGDGFGDLAVGAYSALGAGVAGGGAVAIYRGSAVGVGNAPMAIVGGVATGDLFGYAAVGGDFNNDGFSDIVVGAHQADPMAIMEAGTVTLFLGSNMGLSTMPFRTRIGMSVGEFFGYSVAAVWSLDLTNSPSERTLRALFGPKPSWSWPSTAS